MLKFLLFCLFLDPLLELVKFLLLIDSTLFPELSMVHLVHKFIVLIVHLEWTQTHLEELLVGVFPLWNWGIRNHRVTGVGDTRGFYRLLAEIYWLPCLVHRSKRLTLLHFLLFKRAHLVQIRWGILDLSRNFVFLFNLDDEVWRLHNWSYRSFQDRGALSQSFIETRHHLTCRLLTIFENWWVYPHQVGWIIVSWGLKPVVVVRNIAILLLFKWVHWMQSDAHVIFRSQI